MNITDVANAARWHIPDVAGAQVMLSGWDFGGSGGLALLHHANGLCAATWAPVAVRLAEHFHVIAVDARGHGDSQGFDTSGSADWHLFAEDLAALVEVLLESHGHDHVALGLGSSLGGVVTAAAAAQRPGRFSRIVMLDPPIHPTANLLAGLGLEVTGLMDPRGQLAQMARRRRSVWPSRDVVREKWAHKPLFAAWTESAFELYLREGFRDTVDGEVELKCDPAVEAHVFATTGSLDPLDYAPRVDAAVSLVRASDGDMSAPLLRAVADLMPRGEYHEIDGGHLLPLEKPEEVVEHVLRFCAVA